MRECFALIIGISWHRLFFIIKTFNDIYLNFLLPVPAKSSSDLLDGAKTAIAPVVATDCQFDILRLPAS
jgi:hypothetical protein